MNMIVSSAAIAGTAIPAAALAHADDQALLDLERDIFEAHSQATANDAEINDCVHVWRDEWLRLEDEASAGRSKLSREEISAAVGRMPEVARQRELNELAQPHYDRMDELIKQMWAIPALTADGKRAKLEVLLCCIMGYGWRDNDHDADYDIRMARKLLIEFVGGQPAEVLADQFAA